MNDAFKDQTPIVADTEDGGDGWSLFNARGDKIATVTGSAAEEVAKTAAAAMNAAASGESAEPVALTSSSSAPAAAHDSRRLTVWDQYAIAAVASLPVNPKDQAAAMCAGFADAMMAERQKRRIV